MSDIPYLAGWNPGASLLLDEKTQLIEEGRDPNWLEEQMKGINVPTADDAALTKLWARWQEAPMRADFTFVEPSDLMGIQAERTTVKRKHELSYSDEALYQRMLGAWLGRCVGCALGKPVECFMGWHNTPSKDRQKEYLLGVSAEEYPLKNYFPGKSNASDKTGALNCPSSWRENIQFMETDDDIRYTVIAHDLLLKKDRNFTTKDVMEAWMDQLPYRLVCTAETQAYRNYVMRYQWHHHNQNVEVDWLWVATHQNPFREWIGAQIRADAWGYAAPGNPELAADFAWRDARMSHIKNGIYGEMFVAAMIAAGFSLQDPLAVVRAGLAEIPQRSRLYVEMEQVIAICQKHGCDFRAFETVLDEIYELLGHYNPVHTNNNAALVVAALLLGKDDFEKVVTLAVMGGWDTDCNGATAGSIYGAMFGADKIPTKWKEPLRDTLYSQIFHYHPIAISECARQSVKIAKKMRE